MTSGRREKAHAREEDLVPSPHLAARHLRPPLLLAQGDVEVPEGLAALRGREQQELEAGGAGGRVVRVCMEGGERGGEI